jgi:hypothetical protein
MPYRIILQVDLDVIKRDINPEVVVKHVRDLLELNLMQYVELQKVTDVKVR